MRVVGKRAKVKIDIGFLKVITNWRFIACLPIMLFLSILVIIVFVVRKLGDLLMIVGDKMGYLGFPASWHW